MKWGEKTNEFNWNFTIFSKETKKPLTFSFCFWYDKNPFLFFFSLEFFSDTCLPCQCLYLIRIFLLFVNIWLVGWLVKHCQKWKKSSVCLHSKKNDFPFFHSHLLCLNRSLDLYIHWHTENIPKIRNKQKKLWHLTCDMSPSWYIKPFNVKEISGRIEIHIPFIDIYIQKSC